MSFFSCARPGLAQIDSMLKYIDTLLNPLPMYRVVLYGLGVLYAVSVVFGFFGWLPYNGVALLLHCLVLLIACVGTNMLCFRLLRIPTNTESVFITVLILAFLVWPLSSLSALIITFLVGVLAMASKYILAIKKVHVFNPAAFAVFVLGIVGQGITIWWAGSLVLLPFVLMIGVLIVRKIRREDMLGWFFLSAFLSIAVNAIIRERDVVDAIRIALVSGPLVFFATVMVTEPLTTPSVRKMQRLYAVIVGLLYGTSFSIGPLYGTPELALLVGNIFSYAVSQKQRLVLTLKKVTQESSEMFTFYFQPNQHVNYLPGQYLEWTLPHEQTDNRGNRRYFTIASSPTEEDIMLGVKIPSGKRSSFKSTLRSMHVGDQLIAGQRAGDFTLPDNPQEKLMFIAGGIGITPFRSMVKYLIDTDQKRDIYLYYFAPSADGFTYNELFDEAAEKIGLQVQYSITREDAVPKNWKGEVGYLTPEKLQALIPDIHDRTYYISGPQVLVDGVKAMLDSVGISPSKIHTDYFPGF